MTFYDLRSPLAVPQGRLQAPWSPSGLEQVRRKSLL